MIIDSINLNHLRIFECVYRCGSMTTAAQELHLTQSGVSQHIKTFEDVLGVRLFDRIKQRLVPTASATRLYRRCAEGLGGIEQALLELKGGERQLAGTITIGLPIEFGNNIVLPLLAKFCARHPLVKFRLRLGFASAMNDELLKGAMDFAFVDEFTMDRRITVEKVYDEVLDLYASEELVRKKGPFKHLRKYYEQFEYVEYQEGEPILRMWFAHHLSTKHVNLNVRAVVMDVQGVARLIESGLGAGVLPGHLGTKLVREGHKLHRFKGCGKPLKNSISVAYLKERSHAPATLAALEWLRSCLRAPGKTAGAADSPSTAGVLLS